jgi:hypothetical protein
VRTNIIESVSILRVPVQNDYCLQQLLYWVIKIKPSTLEKKKGTTTRKMKLVFSAIFVSICSNAIHGKRISASFSGIVKVSCDGMDVNKLDDISMTIFSQAVEDSYDDLDETKKKGTYINVGYVCTSLCKNDDTRRKKPRYLSKEAQEGNYMEFEVDWICGDNCPGDDFVASSFSDSIIGDGASIASSATIGSVRGTTMIKGDADVGAWENHLIRTLIDTRRNDFRAIDSCMIKVVPGSTVSLE